VAVEGSAAGRRADLWDDRLNMLSFRICFEATRTSGSAQHLAPYPHNNQFIRVLLDGAAYISASIPNRDACYRVDQLSGTASPPCSPVCQRASH